MSGRKAVYPEVNINRFNHAYTSENERFITGYICFLLDRFEWFKQSLIWRFGLMSLADGASLTFY